MFNKWDAVLAVVAIVIVIHLLSVYTTTNYINTQYY